MTSKPPTAVEEIQARIETLNKQIEQALIRASETQEESQGHSENAERLALLCTQYEAVLKATSDPRATLIEVHGEISDPTFVAQLNRHSRWSR